MKETNRKDFAGFIVDHNKGIRRVFLILLFISLLFTPFVNINYDLTKYLPANAPSKAAINKMEETFGYPGTARLMLKDVTIYEANAMKQQLEKIEGVDRILWLDTTENVYESNSFMKDDDVSDYYKDNKAVMDVTFVKGDSSKLTHKAIDKIEEIIGDKGYLVGSAPQNKFTEEEVSSQMNLILAIGVIFVFLVLLVTTSSWFEPVLFLSVIGTAIFINRGTNIFLNSISFITNNVSAVLQLAVSMDYSIFLLNAYKVEQKKETDKTVALKNALRTSIKTISASSLTTFVGFIVFVIMKFSMGFDLGIVLAKGIVCSIFSIVFFMPSLILSWMPIIEKTRHKEFLPEFDKTSKFVNKVSKGFFIFAMIILIPSYVAQGMTNFMYGNDAVGAGEGTLLYEHSEEINKVFGRSNLNVILVPANNNVTERALAEKLKSLDYVKSVTSLADTLPEGIPERIIPSDTASLLHKAGYARILVFTKTKGESKLAYKAANEIKQTVNEYYPNENYITGNTYATMDMENILKDDYNKVNNLSLLGVFLVVAFSFKSVLLAVLAMIPIEMAIFVNMSFSYIYGTKLAFIGYIVVSSIQLGATVDYAILSISNYRELRKRLNKKESAIKMTKFSMHSIITSGTILVICGYVVSFISKLPAIGQLGHLIGRGAIVSMTFVIFLLPALLILFDGLLVWENKMIIILKQKLGMK
ncbi:MAG: RND family transporter [Lachnoanaerobaculum saburreum]